MSFIVEFKMVICLYLWMLLNYYTTAAMWLCDPILMLLNSYVIELSFDSYFSFQRWKVVFIYISTAAMALK